MIKALIVSHEECRSLASKDSFLVHLLGAKGVTIDNSNVSITVYVEMVGCMPACTSDVEINDQRQPVPVDEDMLNKIAELSDGNHYSASTLEQLKEVFTSLQDQIGYETIKGDASTGWLRLGSLLLALAALAALLINRRLPG